MKPMRPTKLTKGSHVRVISPSLSLAIISDETRRIAEDNFKKLGLSVSFSKNAEESDDNNSSRIQSRLNDLHDAFADPGVDAIFTTIGGYNCNQLLDGINWELIRNNPKIFCGFSDITALNNALLAKANLITYSGPHFSTLGQKILDEFTLDHLRKCLFADDKFAVEVSSKYTDDAWWLDQDHREASKNNGLWEIHEGMAEGIIIGGNLCTLNLLQGTEFMPATENIILFIEDDEESGINHFERDLVSLLQTQINVRGIVVGRFQKASQIGQDQLTKMINNIDRLTGIPIIANADFGHTDPKITFPIGGQAVLDSKQGNTSLRVTVH